MDWMRGMIHTDPPRRSTIKSPYRVALLSAALVGSLLTVYVGGYLVLRSQDIVTDEAQYGSSFDNRTWMKAMNWLAVPGYAIELRWRFLHMPERWQRCVDAGLVPEGERGNDLGLAQFWYRQGYLDAIPEAMTLAICGASGFTTPLHRDPAGMYWKGYIDGERIVQVVVKRDMEEHGFDWNYQGRIQPSPTLRDLESGQVQFSGTATEHAQLQHALDALRVKFGLKSQSSSSVP